MKIINKISHIDAGRRNSYLLLTLVAIFIFTLSYFTIWVGDDIIYHYDFANLKPIRSFRDIFESQAHHYMIANGRYSVHMIVQTVVNFGNHFIFSLLNALMNVLMITQICKLAGRSTKDFKTVLTITILFLFSFQTFMTPAHQINYIWSFSFILLFLNLLFGNYQLPKSPYLLPLLCIYGLFCGNLHEGINVGLGLSLLILLIKDFKKLSIQQKCLIISFGIGDMILCLAPSMLSRAANYMNENQHAVLKAICFSRSIYILIGVMLYRILNDKVKVSTIFRDNWFYFVAMITLIIFNICIGLNVARQFFGQELMAIVIILNITKRQALNRYILAPILIVIALLYTPQVIETLRSHKYYDEIINQYRTSNDGKVYVDFVFGKYSRAFTNTPNLDYRINNYELYTINRLLHDNNPEAPQLRVLPTCLKGMDNVRLKSWVVKLTDNRFVLIKAANDSASYQCKIEHRITHKPQPSQPVTAADSIYGSKYWTAYWLSAIHLDNITNVERVK